MMPAEPRPAMTRPPMNMDDDVATPQTNDPTSNTRKKMRNVH